MARVLHVLLAALYENEPHGPGERETTHHREALRPHFPATHGQQKFVQVVHALVYGGVQRRQRSCYGRAFHGGNKNLYLPRRRKSVLGHRMASQSRMANSSRVAHLCIVDCTKLQRYRYSPKVSSDLCAELLDIAYLFVAEKALRRVKKRLPFLEKLHAQVSKDPSTNKFQKKLVGNFLVLATLVTSVNKAGFRGHSQQEDWREFRSIAHLLYLSTISEALSQVIPRFRLEEKHRKGRQS